MTRKHEVSKPTDQYQNIYDKARMDGVPLPAHNRPREGLIFRKPNTRCLDDNTLRWAGDIHLEYRIKENNALIWRVACQCPECHKVFTIYDVREVVPTNEAGYTRY